MYTSELCVHELQPAHKRSGTRAQVRADTLSERYATSQAERHTTHECALAAEHGISNR